MCLKPFGPSLKFFFSWAKVTGRVKSKKVKSLVKASQVSRPHFPKLEPVLFYSVCSWLISCLWLRSGKQERTAKVPSFQVVCGLGEHVWFHFAIWVPKKLHSFLQCSVFIKKRKDKILLTWYYWPMNPFKKYNNFIQFQWNQYNQTKNVIKAFLMSFP